MVHTHESVSSLYQFIIIIRHQSTILSNIIQTHFRRQSARRRHPSQVARILRHQSARRQNPSQVSLYSQTSVHTTTSLHTSFLTPTAATPSDVSPYRHRHLTRHSSRRPRPQTSVRTATATSDVSPRHQTSVLALRRQSSRPHPRPRRVCRQSARAVSPPVCAAASRE